MRLNLTFLLPQDVLSGAWRQVWGQLGEMGDTAKLGMNVRKLFLVGFARATCCRMWRSPVASVISRYWRSSEG
jgi:hypothetical protein